MDEYDQGMDTATKAYLKKVINSFFMGALWLLVISTLGFFFDLAVVHEKLRWQNIAFYLFFLISLLWLLRYYYRKWKGDFVNGK